MCRRKNTTNDEVFIDTNNLIDFLAARQPFAEDAMILFQLADNDEIELMVSDLTIINTIYILRRMHYGLSEIYDSLDTIRPLLTVTSMGETAIDRCLQHRSDDFEDEMQYLSAVDADADYILTRNKEDFDFGDSAVMTPREFFDEQNIDFE